MTRPGQTLWAGRGDSMTPGPRGQGVKHYFKEQNYSQLQSIIYKNLQPTCV